MKNNIVPVTEKKGRAHCADECRPTIWINGLVPGMSCIKNIFRLDPLAQELEAVGPGKIEEILTRAADNRLKQ